MSDAAPDLSGQTEPDSEPANTPPLVEHEPAAPFVPPVIPDPIDQPVHVWPRPSCCVVCRKPTVGYAHCGAPSCVEELLRPPGRRA